MVRQTSGMTLRALVAVLWLMSPLGALPQANPETVVSEISQELVRARLEQVQSSSVYPEETKSSAVELYRRALVNLQAAQADSDAALRFEQARTGAPLKAEEIRKALAANASRDPLARLSVDDRSSARDIEQRLQQERANEAAAEAKLSEIEQNLSSEESRAQVIRQRLTSAGQESKQIAQNLSQAITPGDADIVAEARRLAQQARIKALTAEIRKLDQELLSQPARIDLLEAQREEVTTELSEIQARIKALQDLLGERRRTETQQVIAEVDLDALGEAGQHPLVQNVARRNRELADELAKLTGELDRLTEMHEAAEAQLAMLQTRYENTRQRAEVAGISQALGRYLAKERRDLPSFAEFRRESRLREDKIAEASLLSIRLEEERRELRDADAYVDELLASMPRDEAAELHGILTSLVSTKRVLMARTVELNSDYLRLLADYEYTETQLFSLVSEYRAFLAERLLWVRSKSPLGLDDLLSLPAEILDFLSPRRWLDAAAVFLNRLTHSPLQIAAVLVLVLFWWRLGTLRALLRSTARTVGKPSEDRFGNTLKAVGLTLLMTLPWPIFTAVTGYELSNSLAANHASQAVGESLLRITPLLFFLRAFRLLCTPKGVAEAHFRWLPEGLARLRKQMDLLLFTLLGPALAMIINLRFRDAELGGGLSQVLFVALVLGLAIFLHRLLGPKHGIAGSLRRRTSEASAIRWPWFWITAATVIPAGVAIMAVAGFMHSAGMLLGKLINSMWLLFGLVFVRELIFRWLLVVRRRLLLREALERREAARAAREKEAAEHRPATSGGDEHAGISAEPAVDIESLDADTRKLVHVALVVTAVIGIGGIWSSVLPALGIFGDITLWEQTRAIGGVEELIPVTLADLLIAALAILLTVVMARTLPSLLEILLRQRPGVTPGSRLAFATLTRYTIAVIGVAFALATIGVNWSKLQWLVAALGVGIGFGLQEIVANFISGLVILMERPIRVGDIVTVGDTSGAVTRVQIRATTIRTWDRQELLVPNKEFITGRVLNWSLSDEVLRIHFLVGIAYGSDVETALKLIAEAAEEHPAVLGDPAPLVTFESFGDNALILGLRCFVASLSVRLETTTDLHRAINRKFNEAGIVIAFPQRDVHLDTSSPLEIKLMQGVSPEASD